MGNGLGEDERTNVGGAYGVWDAVIRQFKVGGAPYLGILNGPIG